MEGSGIPEWIFRTIVMQTIASRDVRGQWEERLWKVVRKAVQKRAVRNVPCVEAMPSCLSFREEGKGIVTNAAPM
jgi:hypothetical protein